MSPARSKAARSGGETSTCPWCSATVPSDAAKCPSCGASLRDAADGEILGVTQIDVAATTKMARMKPGRLAGWLGADTTTEKPELSGRIEPPSEEVRREMLKLELAAIDAEIEAKRLAAAQQELPSEDAPEGKPG
jgi:hypothetical protein